MDGCFEERTFPNKNGRPLALTVQQEEQLFQKIVHESKNQNALTKDEIRSEVINNTTQTKHKQPTSSLNINTTVFEQASVLAGRSHFSPQEAS